MGPQRAVAVVGGGISGLATAHYLTHGGSGRRRPGHPVPRVAVLEAAPVLGGKISTVPVAGFPVDTGPDAVLVRSPHVRELFADLGLAGDLRAATSRQAYVWTGGRLRPLPPGSVFGVPERLLPLLRSGLLSPRGVLRAAADLVLPRHELTDDPSIADLLLPRFGREVFERMVEPLLGGVHAGRAEALSARSAVPEVFALARRHRSTYLALRQRRGATRPGAPNPASAAAAPGAPQEPSGLLTLEGGLSRLVHALHCSLLDVDVRPGSRVSGIEPEAGRVRVHLEDAPPLDVDDVVLATPAWETARLLGPACPEAADLLDGIPYVGVATVTLAYPRSAVRRPLDGTGFLVPPVEGRLLVGCSWLTAKWAHLHDESTAVFRCMVGRYGDQRWAELDDDALVTAVHEELAEAVGLDARPGHAHVRRWPRAMPQYLVGHAHRLRSIVDALVKLPGVHLTGAGYEGLGLAACVTQAKAVAGRVLDREVDPSGAGPGAPTAIDLTGAENGEPAAERTQR